MANLKNETLTLAELHARKRNPIPFEDCGSLPWNDPDISRRMLQIHLSQNTDQATRKADQVQAECAFLDGCFRHFAGENLKLLDLTCGPGLYAEQLAEKGHHLTGVDFSPAAIEYAKSKAAKSGLSLEFVEQDLLSLRFKSGSFDGCYYIYGMPNALTRDELTEATGRIAQWLRPGGVYVSEIMTLEGLRDDLEQSWETRDWSVLSNKPHLWLDEKIWHQATRSQVYRIYVADLETGDVKQYGESHQAYTVREYSRILDLAGLDVVDVFAGLADDQLDDDSDWAAFVAVKR